MSGNTFNLQHFLHYCLDISIGRKASKFIGSKFLTFIVKCEKESDNTYFYLIENRLVSIQTRIVHNGWILIAISFVSTEVFWNLYFSW